MTSICIVQCNYYYRIAIQSNIRTQRHAITKSTSITGNLKPTAGFALPGRWSDLSVACELALCSGLQAGGIAGWQEWSRDAMEWAPPAIALIRHQLGPSRLSEVHTVWLARDTCSKLRSYKIREKVGETIRFCSFSYNWTPRTLLKYFWLHWVLGARRTLFPIAKDFSFLKVLEVWRISCN